MYNGTHIAARDLSPEQTMIYGGLLLPAFPLLYFGRIHQTMCFGLAWHIPNKLSILCVLEKGLCLRKQKECEL